MNQRKSFLKKWGLYLILATLGLSAFFYFDIYREKSLAFDLHGIVDDQKTLENWIPFSPEEESFSIYFPSNPTETARELPIPGSSDSLSYREFYSKSDDHYLFSISHTALPSRWLQLSSELVLKGALKMVLRELGKVSLVGKSSNQFKDYPALDYEHYSQEKETVGTLVLVDATLYKIEVTYPLGERKEAQKTLVPFIQSFQPSNSLLAETPSSAEELECKTEDSVDDTPLPPQEELVEVEEAISP